MTTEDNSIDFENAKYMAIKMYEQKYGPILDPFVVLVASYSPCKIEESDDYPRLTSKTNVSLIPIVGAERWLAGYDVNSNNLILMLEAEARKIWSGFYAYKERQTNK